MKFIRKFWTILFIFIVWFVFSSPYFLQGKIPYSSTYQVNFFPPWSMYEKFHGPIKNNAMPDIATQIFPWKKLTIDTYKSGQLPLWNPYNFSGNPHLANNQSAVLSPFNLLFFIFPFVDAWSLLILLQPILAGLFMYLMLRSFDRSPVASLAGSITFMFCGFMVVWMAYGTLSYAILFLPLAIYSVQKYIKTSNKKFLFLLSLTIPLSFFSGHFQTSLYLLMAALAFIIFKIIEEKKFAILLVSVLIGIILSLPQLLPSFEFYQSSVRSSSFLKSETIPSEFLSTIFAPDFFGSPVTRNDWFGHYAEWASFVGIISLTLVFLSFIKKNKTVLFFSGLGFIALFLALDTPLSSAIVSLKIPVISTSSLSRIIVIFSFCLAALSAFGLDNLLELLKKGNLNKAYKILPAFLLVIVFLIVIPFINIIPPDKVSIALKGLRIPMFLLSALFFCIFVQVKFRNLKFIHYIIILLISIQSVYFASKWMPFDPRALVFPELPIVESIKTNIGNGRLFGNFGAEISSYYGVGSIEGYDPLFIERYGEFIQSADFGDFNNALRSVVKISRRGEQMNRAIDLLGVNLIFHPVADTNQNWAFPVWEDSTRFVKVFDDNKIQIFRNNNALKRAELFYDYEVIEDKREMIRRFYAKDFDFRKILLLEESPGVKLDKEERGSAEIVRYTPNVIQIKAYSKSLALLFLSDNFYPGWRAYVNGKETKILRADYTFRAVVVPAGESEVLFKFDPTL